MSCQKIVNVLAVSSAVVSLAVVGSVGYVFANKDAIIKGITDGAMESVLGGLGGGTSDALPVGSNDLMMDAPQAAPIAAPQANAL